MNDEKNFLEKAGLEVAFGEVEVGNTYPIYGMITKILSEDLDNFRVEINKNINCQMHITEKDKAELIKQRSFEPGIFICKILSKDDNVNIEVDCQTVVFGKQQVAEV